MNANVEQIMSREIISINPDDSASSAAQLMEQHNIGSLPIVNGEKELEGILTDRDIVVRCVARHMDPECIKAREIMTDRIACIHKAQPVSEAISMMATEQIRRLPVVDDGKLVGMISFADIARRDTSPEIAEAISDISAPALNDMDFVRQYNPHQ